MSYTNLLNELSNRIGILTSFYHPDLGKEVTADKISKQAICRAMGYPADTELQIQKSLQKLNDEPWQNFAPYVKVSADSEMAPLMLHLIIGDADKDKILSFTLTREDGTTQSGQVNLAEQQFLEQNTINDVVYHRYQVRFYLDVKPGYHALSFLLDNKKIDSNALTRLIVVPRQCYVQESLLSGHRAWGVPLQLYGLPSERNWGMGDLTDLADFARLAKTWGADIVGINPLNALFSDAPEMASPYSPSSRAFFNPLYIDTDAVPEAKDCQPYLDYKNSDRFKEVIAYARDSNQVVYDYVTEVKLTALEILFKVFKGIHLDEKSEALTPRGTAFLDFCNKYGDELDNYAVFQVLRQYFKVNDGSPLWWRWDIGYASPTGENIPAFRKKYADSILFVKYKQFLAFEQYDAAAAVFKEENFSIGLYTDLPVSVGANSAEVWANPDLFLKDLTAGAPPDLFNKQGQDWGLSAFDPRELKRVGYAPFIRIIQNVMRGAGAIRIDHGFGLMRLYLRVLNGGGAYLKYPFEDLMGIIALESMRNQCLVIAEDLGTAPDGFHDQMRNYRTLSFRLFRYQKYGEAFIAPKDYDRMCVITAGTHDLPTYAAFWKGLDLDLAVQYKTITQAYYAEDSLRRLDELGEIISAFKSQGLPTAMGGIDQTQLPDWFIPDTYRYLARSSSLVLMVRLEDVLEQEEQVNLPGTYLEYPNWRYKLPVKLEDLSQDPRIQNLSAEIVEERK